MVEGSSSSQSASLLLANQPCQPKTISLDYVLIQLLRLLDNLLLILPRALGRRLFLRLVAKIRSNNLHLAAWSRFPESKVRVVEHLDGKIDALGSEVENQSVAFEFPLVVSVQFDARFAAVDFFGDDAAFGEDGMDLVDVDIEGEIGDVESCVLALAWFQCGFGFLGDEAAAYFLQEAHTHQLGCNVKPEAYR